MSSGTKTYKKNVVERIRDKFLNTTTFSQYTKESISWFNSYIQDNFVRRLNNPGNFLRQNKTLYPKVGSMYLFSYDPKFKETLPYYDTFPMVLVLSVDKESFLGLNFHYVHPNIRAKILVELLKIVNNENYDERTKFKLTYNLCRSIPTLKSVVSHMIKRYLFTHLKTPLSTVSPDVWEIVIFLPLQNFKKSSTSQVWQDSRRN